MRIQVQLAKRIELARAELTRLENAARVIAELERSNGNGKARTFDHVARALANGTAEEDEPAAVKGHGKGNGLDLPGIEAWRSGKRLTHDQRNKVSLAVIRAFARAGHHPSREEVLDTLRTLGFTPNGATLGRMLGVKNVARDRKGRYHLTTKGEGVIERYE